MVLCGLRIGSLCDGGYVTSRRRTRTCLIPVEACGANDTYLFPNRHQFFSVSAQSLQEYPKSRIYNVKEEEKGVSEFDLVTSGTSYAKKEMVAEIPDEGELIDIKEGDIINLPDLLFTEHRDYLVKNNGEKVKADQYVGKAILLYFVPVCLDRDCGMEKQWTTFLIDIYNELLPNKDFEVIFVAVDDICSESFLASGRDPQKIFESLFARMPWTAIPFSDLGSRKRIAKRFGVLGGEFFCGVKGGKLRVTCSVSLDSRGMVLKRNACYLFEEYGTPGYPFTKERIKFLDSEDDAVAKQPSLESLLGSPERDYVISNQGDRVPIHTLKDKIPFSQFAGKRVLIYFEMNGLYQRTHWEKILRLKDLYLKMKGTEDEFEVIYIKDSLYTRNPDSLWIVPDYGELPWLVHYYDEGYSLPKELEQSIFHFNCSHGRKGCQLCLLVAFERDGSLVRKTFYPTINDVEFPFYAGGLEKEYVNQLDHHFGWYYWDYMNKKWHRIIYQRR